MENQAENVFSEIAAMFNGVCNESGNITTTFILAKNSAMLDEKKYFAM